MLDISLYLFLSGDFGSDFVQDGVMLRFVNTRNMPFAFVIPFQACNPDRRNIQLAVIRINARPVQHLPVDSKLVGICSSLYVSESRIGLRRCLEVYNVRYAGLSHNHQVYRT